jgi:hypothetical protein
MRILEHRGVSYYFTKWKRDGVFEDITQFVSVFQKKRTADEIRAHKAR